MITNLVLDKAVVESFVHVAEPREKLNIQSGDRLLVDVQNGVLILIPQPQDHVAYLADLHKEIWAGVDTTAYLREEREAWNDSDTWSRAT